MARNTWLAVALACLVWFVYLKWFVPQPQPQTQKQPSTQTQQAATTSQTGQQKPAAVQTESATTYLLPPFELSFPASKMETLKNSELKVSFAESGGKVAVAKVLKYRQTIEKDSEHITPVSLNETPFSLALLFSNQKLSRFSNGNFKSEVLSDDAVRYFKKNEGISVSKKYILSPDYVVQNQVQISFPNPNIRDWGYLYVPVGGNKEEVSATVPLQAWEVVTFQNDEVEREAYKSIEKKEEVVQGNTSWLAFGNRYFATAVINESEINPDVVYSKQSKFTGAYLRFPLILKQGQSSIEFNFKFFIGPKDFEKLEPVGLKPLIDYGWWGFLAHPMFLLMKFFYSVINNWGVAIILLTIVVRTLFYPLSLKSYKSMKAMQKLQPQLKAMKEKYKDDMQRFNREQMAMFKAHKVNPMGGCLPILIQLPVFIALYTVLSNSIELFHSPFFGWIQDLTAKDPFYVYPILMGVAMFLQQKMTPTGGMDPMQAKIMLLMPIIFTIIMLNLPSGLTIYIFLSTLLGITQQWFINRSPSPKPVVVQNEGASK